MATWNKWAQQWQPKIIFSYWLVTAFNQLNQVPLVGSILRQLRYFSVPLEFVEFTNNGHRFVALLDSGAQLNVINTRLLSKLDYSILHPPKHLNTLQGVQGQISPIEKWIEISIQLNNGHNTTLQLAVIKDLSNGIIFGRPFLLQVQAVVDHFNRLMITKHGPVNLIEDIIPKPLLQSNLTLANKTYLNSDALQTMHNLLTEFNDLWEGKRKSLSTTIKHRIQLTTGIPINTRPRRMTPEQQRIIDSEVNKMLADGIIRPSTSSYASELTLVQKKSGEWRPCVDYRALNKVTVPDRYPMPRITDLIRRVQESCHFIKLDLRSGYWQVSMDPESIKYTAFRCFKGLFEFLVMPFGLINAGATFQRLIDTLFGDRYFQDILGYSDDLLIHNRTIEETIGSCRTCLERLRKENLTINLEKCEFFPMKLKFLGQIITNGTIIPDDERVVALRHITPPATIHEVRALLGMIGYYQQYIPHYSEIMVPITNLLQSVPNSKRQNRLTIVDWKGEHKKAVALAIDALGQAVLKIPLDSDQFLLETDASEIGLGAALSCLQNDGFWAPVEFISKKIFKTQLHWPTREKEAYAIIFGLQKFEHYLRGRSFTVHTDHESLQWLLEAKTGKLARWASRLAEFDMKIIHKSGVEMTHIDFLSRYVDMDQDPNLQSRMVYTVSPSPLPSIEEVLAEQQKVMTPSGKGFFFRDNKWYFRNGVWVPPKLRVEIMAACHSLTPFGHPGVKRTKRLVTRVFNWPNIHTDITKFIKGCLICQQSRPGLDRLQGLFRPHPIPGPFHTIYMDYWSCDYHGPRIVLTMVDQFTKWAECTLITDKSERVVTSAFIKSWVCRFGVPQILMTDNDKTFLSAMFRGIANRLGITTLRTTVYHPEGNAPIEAFHKVLRKGLTQFLTCQYEAVPFDEALQLVLLSYRSIPHSLTTETPAFLTYGVDPRSALDNDWRLARDERNQQRLQFLNNMRLDIQFQMVRKVERDNMQKNQGRFPTIFQLHMLVLTRNTPLDLIRMAHHHETARKLVPRWSLPYRIIKVFDGGKKALARNLLTHHVKEIHIQDARPIGLPQGDKQQKEWEGILDKAELSMQDAKTKETVFQRFWDEVFYPQVPVPNIHKRPRVLDAFAGGDEE